MHLAPPWSAEKEGCFKQQENLKEINGIEFLSPMGSVSWRYAQSLSQWLLRLVSMANLPGCHLLSECEQSVCFPVISETGYLYKFGKKISFFSYKWHYWDISSNFASACEERSEIARYQFWWLIQNYWKSMVWDWENCLMHPKDVANDTKCVMWLSYSGEGMLSSGTRTGLRDGPM